MLPVTRFLCLASLFINVPVIIRLVNPYRFIFIREHVTQKYQIWRIFTSFFLSYSHSGISYVYELVMLYIFANQLESGPFATRSADFAWQLIFVGAAIIIVTLPYKVPVFTPPFLVALAFLSSSLASRTAQMSLFGILYVPMIFTPYLLVVMDLFIYGIAAPVLDIVGLIVGYLWWVTMWAPDLGRSLDLRPFGRAPDWLGSLVE